MTHSVTRIECKLLQQLSSCPCLSPSVCSSPSLYECPSVPVRPSTCPLSTDRESVCPVGRPPSVPVRPPRLPLSLCPTPSDRQIDRQSIRPYCRRSRPVIQVRPCLSIRPSVSIRPCPFTPYVRPYCHRPCPSMFVPAYSSVRPSPSVFVYPTVPYRQRDSMSVRDRLSAVPVFPLFLSFRPRPSFTPSVPPYFRHPYVRPCPSLYVHLSVFVHHRPSWTFRPSVPFRQTVCPRPSVRGPCLSVPIRPSLSISPFPYR